MLITPKDRFAMLDAIGINGKDCAEIGVSDGAYAKAILNASPKSLMLVDPWTHQSETIYPDDHNNVSNDKFEELFDHVTKTLGSDRRVRIVRDYSYAASANVQNESLDFVYIDAIHTFTSSLCDISVWYHKVRKGGWLCGHDYTGTFVGVKMAVDGFCRITGQQLALMTLDTWASWGIRKSQ